MIRFALVAAFALGLAACNSNNNGPAVPGPGAGLGGSIRQAVEETCSFRLTRESASALEDVRNGSTAQVMANEVCGAIAANQDPDVNPIVRGVAVKGQRVSG